MGIFFRNGYALLIGVGAHRDSRIYNLPATINDVNRIKETLLNPATGAYIPENVKILTDERATSQNIVDGLNWLVDRALYDPEATAIFYFSGHGWKTNIDKLSCYYLIPHDCNWDDIVGSAISAEKLSEKLNQISAPRLVAFIDACHSGGATKEEQSLPHGFHKSPLPASIILNQLKSGKGRVVISSSKEDERSFIKAPDYNYSIFTYHLLEALSGKAHTYTGKIGIIDVYSYLAATVPTTAKKQTDYLTGRPAQQHPIMDGSKTDNFLIALPSKNKSLPRNNSVILISGSEMGKGLTQGQVRRLQQRQRELKKQLDLYLPQRLAIEKDIILSAQDGQKQFIFKERLKEIEAEINKLQISIDRINMQLARTD